MLGFSRMRVMECLFLLAPTFCAAQGSPTHVTSVEILVQVTFDNDRNAGDQIRVELISETGVPVAQMFTDAEGRTMFHVAGAGTYEIHASGTPVAGTTVERIRIEDMDKNRTVYLRVKPRSDATPTATKVNAPPVTSAAELKVPADAKKAFHKGMEAWEHNDYPKAAEQFEKGRRPLPSIRHRLQQPGSDVYPDEPTRKSTGGI